MHKHPHTVYIWSDLRFSNYTKTIKHKCNDIPWQLWKKVEKHEQSRKKRGIMCSISIGILVKAQSQNLMISLAPSGHAVRHL